jgi:hypothetical protein
MGLEISLSRKTKAPWNFLPEIRAIWHAAPKLTLCPRFRRAGIDKLLAHIENDKCQRCLAVYSATGQRKRIDLPDEKQELTDRIDV